MQISNSCYYYSFDSSSTSLNVRCDSVHATAARVHIEILTVPVWQVAVTDIPVNGVAENICRLLDLPWAQSFHDCRWAREIPKFRPKTILVYSCSPVICVLLSFVIHTNVSTIVLLLLASKWLCPCTYCYWSSGWEKPTAALTRLVCNLKYLSWHGGHKRSSFLHTLNSKIKD